MQTVQLVIFYLYLMFHACLQTFNEMRYKVFGWELNTVKVALQSLYIS
jgi:hypothetical protein